MSETDLFTAKVFQVKNNESRNNDPSPNQESRLVDELKFFDQHPNMVSARVVKVSELTKHHLPQYELMITNSEFLFSLFRSFQYRGE